MTRTSARSSTPLRVFTGSAAARMSCKRIAPRGNRCEGQIQGSDPRGPGEVSGPQRQAGAGKRADDRHRQTRVGDDDRAAGQGDHRDDEDVDQGDEARTVRLSRVVVSASSPLTTDTATTSRPGIAADAPVLAMKKLSSCPVISSSPGRDAGVRDLGVGRRGSHRRGRAGIRRPATGTAGANWFTEGVSVSGAGPARGLMRVRGREAGGRPAGRRHRPVLEQPPPRPASQAGVRSSPRPAPSDAPPPRPPHPTGNDRRGAAIHPIRPERGATLSGTPEATPNAPPIVRS